MNRFVRTIVNPNNYQNETEAEQRDQE